MLQIVANCNDLAQATVNCSNLDEINRIKCSASYFAISVYKPAKLFQISSSAVQDYHSVTNCIQIASKLQQHPNNIQIASKLHQNCMRIASKLQSCMQIASKLHPNCSNMQIASTLQNCMQIASKFHQHFIEISFKFHLNFIKNSSKFHPNFIQISSDSRNL